MMHRKGKSMMPNSMDFPVLWTGFLASVFLNGSQLVTQAVAQQQGRLRWTCMVMMVKRHLF